MAPVTRSRTHSSDSGADAQPLQRPTAVTKMTARLSRTLTDLADTDPVHGRDAKALRDAAPKRFMSPDGQLPRVSPYTGSGDNATQFSIWLRRLEDVLRVRLPGTGSRDSSREVAPSLEDLSSFVRSRLHATTAEDKDIFLDNAPRLG
ncbi:hypothetical protein ANCCAN_12654 [Ancylostoma caninum]|uniref:Uncharacterized protein n=1 Tax=Ancylostoma caninum TaxID=29170 RepID=A0A368GEZ2_ANCCA|nr:hypothetical protein ANCCAN_12654 [Ancylostoma caninum]